MNPSAADAARFDFDDPKRRLVWTLPLGGLLWAAVLVGFSWLLERTAVPPPELTPVQARIIELPPAGAAGGAIAPPAAPRPLARPATAAPVPRTLHRHRAPVRTFAPPAAPPARAAPAARAVTPPAASGASSAARTRPGGDAGALAGTAGLGSDSAGARAIFAPTPEIPDDLREEAFNAVAVAHFRVAADGAVAVALTQPTPNPALNAILIDTLRQWRFFPAMRDGAPVASEFDLRIPISVR